MKLYTRIPLIILLILASVFHYNLDGTHAFASYISQADTATSFAQPDIVKIRTNDKEGASDPVVITVTDLETGQVYRDTTEQGIAEINLKEVGIQERTRPLATLLPNPISDYAELRIDPTTQIEQIRVLNAVGQEVSNNDGQAGTIDINGKPGMYFFQLQDKNGNFQTHKAILTDGTLRSINGDNISGSDVLRFTTSYGTYYANSSSGSWSATIFADPDENVQMSGNASDHEDYFISVVYHDSKTGSGPAVADPDDLDNGSLMVILGKSSIVNNSTWQATQGSPGGFHRGGTLDLEVYDWDEHTQAPAGSAFTSSQSTALSYVPGACNVNGFGQIVSFSGSPTIIPGAPTSSSGKVLSYTNTAISYTNAPNPGMDGTVVIVGGTNVNSIFVESMEWLTGQGGEGYFFSGTSMTEAGECKIAFTRYWGY